MSPLLEAVEEDVAVAVMEEAVVAVEDAVAHIVETVVDDHDKISVLTGMITKCPATPERTHLVFPIKKSTA